jgi:hypothetical protein
VIVWLMVWFLRKEGQGSALDPLGP